MKKIYTLLFTSLFYLTSYSQTGTTPDFDGSSDFIYLDSGLIYYYIMGIWFYLAYLVTPGH